MLQFSSQRRIETNFVGIRFMFVSMILLFKRVSIISDYVKNHSNVIFSKNKQKNYLTMINQPILISHNFPI